MSVLMLGKMETKLGRLEGELAAAQRAGGHCLDLEGQVLAQREKIAAMRLKVASFGKKAKPTPSARNTIDPRLFKLCETRILIQWENDPRIFYIRGLSKVGVTTRNGVIQPVKNMSDCTEHERTQLLNVMGMLANTD